MSSTDPQDAACMAWASARLRMARMVHPQGCAALVDHVVLFRAPCSPTLSLAVESGRTLERALERREAGGSRAEWRLVDVLALDLLERHYVQPDGAEVYRTFVDRPGNDVGGTVRHRLGWLADGGAGDGLSWYSAALRLVRTTDGPGDDVIEDRVYTFRSTDFDAASERAIAIGRAQALSFTDWNGHRIEWRLAAVRSPTLLGAGALGDIVVVHREPVAMTDADRVPFDAVFHPERSKPETIGLEGSSEARIGNQRIWTLWFVREPVDGPDVETMLGLYSTEALANAARERASALPWVNQTPDDTLLVVDTPLNAIGWTWGFARADD